MIALYLLAAGAAAPAADSHASALAVSPVSIERVGRERTAVITVRNDGKGPVNIQLRPYRWTQADGKEELVRTDELVATPPATTLAPGQRNVVRLFRVGATAPDKPEAYRLLIDEIPDLDSMRSGTVHMALRYSIPVFFLPTNDGTPEIAWRISRVDGKAVLSASNRGSRHARLSAVALTRDGTEIWSRKGLLGYVLAGSTMSWPLPDGADAGSGSLSITANTQRGRLTGQVLSGN